MIITFEFLFFLGCSNLRVLIYIIYVENNLDIIGIMISKTFFMQSTIVHNALYDNTKDIKNKDTVYLNIAIKLILSSTLHN